MIKYPKCYSDNPDTQRFCGECGTRLHRKGPIGTSGPTEEVFPSLTKTLETPIKELTTGSTFAGRYKIIEELDHPFTLGFALAIAGKKFHQLRRDGQAAREYSEAEMRIATEEGFVLFQADGAIFRGWGQVEKGQVEEGIAQMRQGMALVQATGAGMIRPHYLAWLADVFGRAGQPEEGLTVLPEALAAACSSGERYYEAEIHRIKGELLMMKGDDEAEVETCFQQAIEVSRRQKAKSLELRAVISLSRLWQKQGKKGETRKLLAEIYGWFTEGFDTVDLKEAKALLEELS